MVDRQIINLPDPSSAICLAGADGQNLKLISEHTGAQLVLRGQELIINGTTVQINLCKELVLALEKLWSQDLVIAQADILAAKQAIENDQADQWRHREAIAKSRRGEIIQPRTIRQQQYVKQIEKHDLVFGIGPAGTGKTYLAVVSAVKAMQASAFDRLILTRPAVEAGERLGFLPGDLQQKINPYLRPLYDALYDLLEAEKIPQMMERGVIEVAPLAYMRGRTLNNAFIIVDEAQNTTSAQMKMILTRLGFKSRMIVTGDITQIDLPHHQKSGLVMAQKMLTGIEGIAFTQFDKSDVVRNPLVQKIVAAYERAESKQKRNR
ncbi:PhoH family protein [Thalassoporum mexicanum PCC 7367]|uniref:PhoH family protein n=1 Tax=Thalassoporum mexicanum TaxID=3457544 RepID=UPI00029F8E07|nr:PhoH family protein [Pseudanabaena sp. PCC 7367]AFY70301.1 PhoH family protein [Pseudanabaena sp. PCC 7367]